MVRVRKRTFWILSLLIPIFYVGLIGTSVWMNKNVSSNVQHVHVIDNTGLFNDVLESNDDVKFIFHAPSDANSIEEIVQNTEETHLLKIPDSSVFDIYNPIGFKITSNIRSSTQTPEMVRRLLGMKIKDLRIIKLGISKEQLALLDVRLDVEKSRLDPDAGEQMDNTKSASAVGFVSGFLIYMFIFIYGSLVLRGVHEEKSSRIVEIIVSSVRPFELMMGKIIGIVMVGLTQFLLWVFLITLVTVFAGSAMGGGMEMQGATGGINELTSGFTSLPLIKIVLVFIFYFISGYLLYSSLFASIAAAVDNQSDMQQFMMPISLPLILSIVALQPIIENPNSSLAIWMSMIPFTAPIAMMGRIAFNPPAYEIFASMAIMIGAFIFTTWIAAKVYRMGILLYGSKVTYKDLWKWLFYK